MNSKLESIFGKSWRTALMGWLSGLLSASWDVADAYQQGAFDGKHGVLLVLAVLMIVKGHVAKDAQVTGLPQDKTPPEQG